MLKEIDKLLNILIFNFNFAEVKNNMVDAEWAGMREGRYLRYFPKR